MNFSGICALSVSLIFDVVKFQNPHHSENSRHRNLTTQKLYLTEKNYVSCSFCVVNFLNGEYIPARRIGMYSPLAYGAVRLLRQRDATAGFNQVIGKRLGNDWTLTEAD